MSEVLVKCQQQDIFKIRDGIPGHGNQKALLRFKRHSHGNGERVLLGCGCDFPVTWLPTGEQTAVLQDVRQAVPRYRNDRK
jgi:hypothetical protein